MPWCPPASLGKNAHIYFDFLYFTEDPAKVKEPGEVFDSLVGKQVEYRTENGAQRTGTIIHQVQAKPSIHFIKFDNDYHIYVYDLVWV